MNLPNNYLAVEVDSLNGKTVGTGFINTYSYELYLFTPKDMIEYTAKEVIENFQLFNPIDGIKYDLNKLFNL